MPLIALSIWTTLVNTIGENPSPHEFYSFKERRVNYDI